MLRMKYWLPAMLAGMAAALGGCAQDVEDIDRTQPDLIEKADLLNGEWYFRQTVTDVPASSQTLFEGYTFETDRIVWEITEDYLVAYRAYELSPGASRTADTSSGDVRNSGIDNDNVDGSDRFLGNPIAAYSISRHVDVQRQYSSSTLEPTNVIVEDSSDREWFDREFIRVDWGANRIASFFFLNNQSVAGSAEFVSEGTNPADAPVFDYDANGDLEYFDFTTRHFVEPDIMSCIYILYGIGLGDCSSQRIETRTSIMRADDESYEPAYYDNDAMARFGYFRTERLSYDEQYGTTLEGRLQFANRHNIWANSYVTDSNGNVVRDANGRRVARALSERTPKPIAYHLSPLFPEELIPYAQDVAEGWDIAFRRAVAAAQNNGDVSQADSVQPMFILCNNPVTATAVYPEGLTTDACGEVGTNVRIGDLRYDVMWWVDDVQQSGPLGYGPSAPNPETGEIISGTAYVYGASIDTYARYSTDMIRFINGDLTPEDLADADYVRDAIRDARDYTVDPRGPASSNKNLGSLNPAQITEPIAVTDMVSPHARFVLESLREDRLDGRFDTLRQGYGWEQRRIEQLRESGLDLIAVDSETLVGTGINPNFPGLPDEVLEPARMSTMLSLLTPEFQQARHMAMAGHDCILEPDFLEDAMLGIARAYEGRTDYDEVYQEIRGLIFKAVMEHEVGHTVGLRHNFGASHDSLNYFDEFWEQKKLGYPTEDEAGNPTTRAFGTPNNLADAYGIARLLPEQIDGRMREYQYSSIMDYSSSFNTDFAGLGRYDLQAILFAYTTGVDESASLDASDPNFNTQDMGYIEVWENPPPAVRTRYTETRNPNGFNETFERGFGVGYRWPTEEYHYSQLVEEFAPGDPDAMVANLFDRGYRKLGDVLESIEQNDPNRPVQVPYVFCTDDFRGTRQFCRVWDRGADPMEQTLDLIDRYREYYYFDYYRRGRTSFMGLYASQVGQRHASRIFQPLVDGYQRWLLTAGVGDLPDDAAWLGTQWTAAAYAGLNLVAEAITTPEPGSYRLNRESGEFELISYSNNVAGSDMYVENGNGRLRFTQYPRDTGEGMYFYQYPVQSGHYWSIVNAMFALTSSTTRVIGETSSGSFDTAFSIPPYLVFEQEMTSLFNAIVLDDQSIIAPLVEIRSSGPVFTQRPLATLDFTSGERVNPETGREIEDGLPIIDGSLDSALGNSVDIDLGFSEAVTAQILAYQAFTSNYSPRYLEQAKVWVLDSGSAPVLDGTFETIQFCDPNPSGAGACYAARAPLAGNRPNLAAAWILQGQELEVAYEEAFAEGGENAARSIGFDIDNLIQDINIGVALDYYLGRTF